MLLWNNPGVRHLVEFVRASLFAIGPDRRRLGTTTVIAFAAGLIQMMLLFVLADAGVALSSRLSSWSFVLGPRTFSFSPSELILASCALAFVLLAMAAPLAKLQTSLNSRAVARMRNRIIKSYLSSSQSYRETHREGYFQQLVGEYCQQVDGLTQQFGSFCVATTTLAALILGGIIISPKIALILMLAAITGVLFVGPFVERIRTETMNKSAVNREVIYQSAQLVRLAEEMSAFGVHERAAGEINKRIAHARMIQHESGYRDALIPFIYQYGTLAVILIFIEGLTVFDPGRHPSFAPLALLLIRVLTYGRQTVSSLQNGGKAVPYVDTLEKELRELDRNHVSQQGQEHVEFGDITLCKLSYRYKGNSPVLEDLNASIAAGEAIGLIGPSGSGKSTLCRLLMKLAVPTEGAIFAGGEDLVGISPRAWAASTAMTFQENKLIFASVADNIRFFRPQFTQEEVESVAKAVRIHDEILAMPQGYETVVGPGIRGMSGGQRQRIAIARALLGRPKLLILDEPTSAIDQKSEELMCRSLEEMKGRVTMVIVSHRPAALGICDRVFRLEAGRLSEAEQPQPIQQSVR